MTDPTPGEPRSLWTPAGVRSVRGARVPVPSYLWRRLPDWLGTRLGVALVVGLALSGLGQVADGKAVGWWFVVAVIPVVLLPPALFVGLRADQRRARKRFVASAIVSGVLVSVLAIVYGWPAALLGLAVVLVVLAGQ